MSRSRMWDILNGSESCWGKGLGSFLVHGPDCMGWGGAGKTGQSLLVSHCSLWHSLVVSFHLCSQCVLFLLSSWASHSTYQLMLWICVLRHIFLESKKGKPASSKDASTLLKSIFFDPERMWQEQGLHIFLLTENDPQSLSAVRTTDGHSPECSWVNWVGVGGGLRGEGQETQVHPITSGDLAGTV